MEPAARLSEPDFQSFTFEDGLGQRSRIVDPTGEASHEVLTLRSSFATVPSFEFALRERAGRLATFRHAYYARVRSVERTSGADPQLRVVSEASQGLRLSNLLAGAQARRVPIDINAALCVIRQLVPAVAMLHESARDVAHGALAPERLVVTSQARLLIVEYVLGAALEQLRYTRERYWTELRIPLPASSLSPRFDHRCDVTQIGVVALSLILGRPLRAEEFPDRIADVVASTWAVSPRGGFEPLPPGLRGWLARALQLDPQRSFQSAVDARAELDTVLGDSELVAAPASLEAFLTRYHATEAVAPDIQTTVRDSPPALSRPPEPDRPLSPKPARIMAMAGSESSSADQFASLDARLTAAVPTQNRPVPVHGDKRESGERRPDFPPAEPQTSEQLSELVTPGLASAVDPHDRAQGTAAASSSVPFTFDRGQTNDYERPREDEPLDGKPPRWWKNWRVIGAAVAVIAVIAAGSSIGARKPAEAEVYAASGTLEVSTNPAGVQAFIDGQLRGTTPLVLALEPGSHMLELRGTGEPRSIPITVNPGAKVSQFVELSSIATDDAAAAATVRAAEPPVSVSSGSAPEAPAAAPAPPANGFVTVTSPVDLQILEAGNALGTSRDRLQLAPGRHELELVNADLGVRATQTVQVSSSRTASIEPVLPTGTISLNAVPWAEVWLDGEKLGETPIGNVSVRLGRHDVVFRHPDLGERHETVLVTAREPARLSVTMQGR
jgi:hypothetical protein